jgi:membrane protein
MVTIENSFNHICRAPEGRSWVRRLPLYWFVLTVGPVAIGMTQYIDNQVDAAIHSVPAWHWFITMAGLVWNLLFTWLFVFAVYRLVPNATVAAKPALSGAAVATVLLLIGKGTLGAYFSNAFKFSVLYSSLGLIPIMMFWVYLMWLVVLFGLEVAMTLQMLHGRSLEELEEKAPATGLTDPAAVLALMEAIAERFGEGRPITVHALAEDLGLPERTVSMMTVCLGDAGILHRLDDKGAVTPARPPAEVPADRLLEIGFSLVGDVGSGRPGILLRSIRAEMLRLTAGATLGAFAAGRLAPVASAAAPATAGGGAQPHGP